MNNETPPLPAKFSSISMNLTIIFIIVSLFIGGILGYTLGQRSKENISKTIQTKSITPTINPLDQYEVKFPEENSVYHGFYRGKDVIFVTNKKFRNIYEKEYRDISFVGELRYLEGEGETTFDFRRINNRQIVLSSLQTEIEYITSVSFSEDKSSLYLSLVQKGTNPESGENIVNNVYQIDATNLKEQLSGVNIKSKLIWSNEIGAGKSYDIYDGTAHVTHSPNNKYIVLAIHQCYPCSMTSLFSVVLNIEIGEEKLLGEVGDIKFDLVRNTFSYKKLQPFKEKCERGEGTRESPYNPFCENGYFTTKKPSGQLITKSLPN